MFLGKEVPEILLSGDHKKIDEWRFAEAVKITKETRPDLLARHPELLDAVPSKNIKSKNPQKPKRR